MQYKGIVRKLTHELMDTGKTYVGKSARVLAKPACAALIAGGLLVSSGIGYHRDYAEAQTPTPYSQNVNVDGHTVSIRQDAGAVPADVDRVRDDFVSLVNNSTVMRDRVKQAAPTNQTKYVLVSRNRTDVGTGGADDASSTVFIDIADINALPPFLKPPGLDANYLASNFLKIVLAHEFAHLLGIGDPQTQENAVTLPLLAIERKSYYGYCRVEDGVEVLPYNVGLQPDAVLVEFNLSSYLIANPGGLFPKLGSVCGSVGGIAEEPEVSGLPKYTSQNQRDRGNTIPIAAGSALAGTAALAAGWYFKKRRE